MQLSWGMLHQQHSLLLKLGKGQQRWGSLYMLCYLIYSSSMANISYFMLTAAAVPVADLELTVYRESQCITDSDSATNNSSTTNSDYSTNSEYC